MNILIESITKIASSRFQARVWRQETEFKDQYSNHDLQMILFDPSHKNISDIAKALLALDRVNAVEVYPISSHGIVLYKDWP